MSKFISSTETRLQNQDESIKGLENQIGQLAKMITNRDPGTLQRNTETNPKDHVKAITLRSGKILEQKEKEKEDQGEETDDTSIANLDAQFGNFLEVFKKFHINIPCADALMQIPRYVKFLKDILAINTKKLGLGEPKPKSIYLQLGDKSIKYPRGLKDDVLVKVDKFIFPADFVVLDMEEDMEMPLILGRLFFATGKALIDIQEGKLRLRVGEEEITFDVFNALKHTLPTDDYFIIDVVDSLVCNFLQEAMKDPLEATLTTELKRDDLVEERAEIVACFNANHPWRKPIRMRLEDLGDRRDLTPSESSIVELPGLELKPLPPHLKYVYLGVNNKSPVIILLL
ncbi:uncharacterized protein [Primulina eburnea]|uniref:uncharacterized protein n=1 Tax=Primulina eburnea TaxID=1245227 RepID=UPI003C6C2756